MKTFEATAPSVLTKERIRENLQVLGDLPSLSPVVAQLIATLGVDDVSVGEVEAIIRRDPVIAAKVVSAANAAAYASLSPTTSIRGALMKLGLVRIRRLALLISLYNVMPGRRAFQELFWRHSLAVAHAAEVIARHVAESRPAVNPDVVFLAGLMHDIGILVLASHYPKQYAAVSAVAGETGMPLWEAEVSVIQIDHGEIGACLGEHWSFPPEVVEAMRFHHRLDLAPSQHRWSAAIVRLADAICTQEPAWDVGEGGVVASDDPTLAELGIGEDEFPALLEETRAEAKRATAVLETVG